MIPLFTQTDTINNLIQPDSVQKAQFVEAVTKIANTDYRQLLIDLANEAMWIGLKIVLALLVWWVGRWLIRKVLVMLEKLFLRKNIEHSLRLFLHNLVNTVLVLLLILTVVQMLGVNVTSILALFASATLAIGMALSGTMQNFAGGVMILLLKPYRVGDYISAQGQSGTVKEIQLFSTCIETPDKQTIYIPNSSISTAIIDNYSTSDLRRADITVSIAYGDDVDVARAEIMALIKADERILTEPAPVVIVSALAESSVNLAVRMWVRNGDYWGVIGDMNERIYKVLPTKGINFPFPQLDVHVHND
ncbi:MAG: mechanosensitive ion channel family protein [Alistipes sp.]|nr:mechanosensitive ion channel family protein [Alistipes sp.]